MSWVSIDVDLDDIWDGMDKNDKRAMAEWLHKDGILDKHTNIEIRQTVRNSEESQGEKELRDNLTKIWNSYYRLSNEDELLIKQISKKL